MRYAYSHEWTAIAKDLATRLELNHINLDRVAVIESKGSKTRRTIARIHSIGKVMQLGMGKEPFYTIELISECFNKQDREAKIKTIIHELLHIPACFGGGFRHHRKHVNSRTVEIEFKKLGDLIHNF